ncbi:MAG: CCA tRNA nucleotidyltransferase [Nitrospirae bacterium]|nr:CCA tRNA nucleotidyltransferase [Nitrospirota bacterium]
MDITKKILSDPVNKWIFSNFKKDIFLVGGYIRDLLLGYKSKDKDFVLKGNVEKIAKKTAKNFKGTFIVLKRNQTYRVALKDNSFLDFSYFSNSILEDLSKRDFTINAIAWSPETGIIAPLGSIKDIESKLIRIINPKNLKDDPLRILRAYRLSAQLSFTIDKNTRKFLKKYSPLITTAASERITEEIIKLLNSDSSHLALGLCNKDKVLINIFKLSPHILTTNIKSIEKFNVRLSKMYKYKKIHHFLCADISQGLKSAGLVRIALLLLKKNSGDLQDITQKLRLSNLIKKKLKDIYESYPHSGGCLTDKKLFKIFNIASDSVYEIAIILSILNKKKMLPLLERARCFMKIKTQPLIRGNEILKLMNAVPGPIVGEIQQKIRERQFLKFIRTKSVAKKWITSNFT